MSAKKLFISYSHKDEVHLENLRTHLIPLERRRLIEPWFDGHVLPGDNLDERIAAALGQADVIILLVSPDFIASEYCHAKEMATAIERHQQGAARVLPIILRECQWRQEPFGRLKALPKDGKPIAMASWQHTDTIWNSIAEAIEAVVTSEPKAETAPEIIDAVMPLMSAEASELPSERRLSFERKPEITDLARDDFKHGAFDHIAELFKEGMDGLMLPLLGRFRRVDANRFTATIYQNGKKLCGCTIWIAGQSFASNSIAYSSNDSGETNSMNEWLTIEVRDGELRLVTSAASFVGASQALTVEEAAKHLWTRFTAH